MHFVYMYILLKFRPLYMFGSSLSPAWIKTARDSEHVENERAECLLEILCQSVCTIYVYIYIHMYMYI